jgi:hypothetical protein
MKENELEKTQESLPQESEAPAAPTELSNLISDEMLLGVYGEILDNIRLDRVQVDEYLNEFANMVINDGDATTSSKEALINLIKTKSDMADKMTRVADLMTRIKMKDRDTFKPYLNGKATHNTINIIESPEALSKAQMISKLKNKPQGNNE